MIEALISRLKATSAVTDLVDQRIYPGRRQQAAEYPAISLVLISGAPVYTDDGEAGLENSRVQIDCWGLSYTSAKLAARAVRESLSAFVGTAGGVVFQYILLDAERDFNESGGNAAEYPFRTQLDFNVWHET